ncbi:MAG: monooxygenase [Hyphomicrobiales bacterium]|nr:monooxygenase [Hyphomicrobiales bacterium]
MHQPDAQPRPSIFYDYKVHPFRSPPALQGTPDAASVAIVGAGPVGLLLALRLAQFGTWSVVLEQELQVSHGSRAIVLTRRSMEILQQAGVAPRFLQKGLPWANGRSFYRGQEVYRMVMPHSEDDRFLPGLNLQQQYIEQYLVEACEASGMVDIRWGSKVIALQNEPGGATLRVDTPAGEYDLTADYAVAADGGRSTIRRLMGLRMEGRAYAGNFVIADIAADLGLPTERLCFFDPEWNPGNNVLVHREPDGIWRLDFRLPEGETAEQALEPARLSDRIDKILAMLGKPAPWKLDWATVYTANTLTLPDYVVGRVIFAGDAAHLLPIFGVRGANTGVQDADALAWRLAMAARGAPAGLLATYSHERVQAAREICEEAGKSTRFMTPPTEGFALMRDAVLSLTLSEDFPKDLLHWRTSRPHFYADSPLNSFPEENAAFAGGPGCGEPLANVRIGPDDFLLDHLTEPGFHLIAFASSAEAGPDLADFLRACEPLPLMRVLVAPAFGEDLRALADVCVADPQGRVAARYAANAGTAYLVRPDGHVCARWLSAGADDVSHAFAIAAGAAS